ncbi:MAG: hypothetical protein M0006_10170 [Magnetospirillum sp.]|nr:hypothetical protein [Magnetospirillum sp.]
MIADEGGKGPAEGSRPRRAEIKITSPNHTIPTAVGTSFPAKWLATRFGLSPFHAKTVAALAFPLMEAAHG